MDSDFHFPTANSNGPPASPKKLSVVLDAPPALSRINSVANPPPSAICGNTTGEGAICVASAMGNVVIRKSLRSLFSERSVRAAKGIADVMSITPVNPAGNPAINSVANLALCPLPGNCSGPRLVPIGVTPSVWYALIVILVFVIVGLAIAKPVLWPRDKSTYARACAVEAAAGTPDSLTRTPPAAIAENSSSDGR
jgi:hypothetical protein